MRDCPLVLLAITVIQISQLWGCTGAYAWGMRPSISMKESKSRGEVAIFYWKQAVTGHPVPPCSLSSYNNNTMISIICLGFFSLIPYLSSFNLSVFEWCPSLQKHFMLLHSLYVVLRSQYISALSCNSLNSSSHPHSYNFLNFVRRTFSSLVPNIGVSASYIYLSQNDFVNNILGKYNWLSMFFTSETVW